jgi:hypothetical protein
MGDKTGDKKDLHNGEKRGIFDITGVLVTDGIKKRLQRQSDGVYSGLIGDQYDAFDEYTNKKHLDINEFLDTGCLKDSKVLDYIKSIDAAIDKFRLENDIIVYKGTEAAWFDGWEIGNVKYIKPYMSTSISEDIVRRDFMENRKQPIFLKIIVPKKTRGIYIGDNTAYRKNQDEFLLRHGLKYRVIERNGNNLKLEVVSE